MLPLIEFFPIPDLVNLIANLPREGLVFLDSADKAHAKARYSFIAVDPFQVLIAKQEDKPFKLLEKELAKYHLETHPNLPPFQGGVAGSFSYELGESLEFIPSAQKDVLAFPKMMLGFYDLVLAFDHKENQGTIFSSGFPEQEPTKRFIRAQQRLTWILNIIQNCKPHSLSFKRVQANAITSNFSKEAYEEAVQKAREYILAGDIFEVNLSQCFSVILENPFEPLALYQVLRQNNPAPFAGYLQFGDHVIASASPERFLALKGRAVESCPIKGTAPKKADPHEDALMREQLLASEKERAENIMIVDLMRNDLSKVCLPHSVKVPVLCGLESFATVHHLVSQVVGTLSPDKSPVDLLKATFPGGSITGAPKIRAMQIIAEIEPSQRGPYCGSLGYIGFNGAMDLSILIRSYVCKKNHVTFQAGGAITYDSSPSAEYQETLDKAQALRRSLLY